MAASSTTRFESGTQGISYCKDALLVKLSKMLDEDWFQIRRNVLSLVSSRLDRFGTGSAFSYEIILHSSHIFTTLIGQLRNKAIMNEVQLRLLSRAAEC